MKSIRNAALLGCIALTACGGEEVDQRQTETTQGLVYKLHDSEPFTGRVTHSKITLLDLYQLGECTISYRKGIPDGKSTCYSNAGEKISEVTIANEKKDGEERIWNTKGKLTHEVSWSEGKKNGRERQFSDDGETLLQDIGWKNGFKDGADKEWDRTGKVVLIDLDWSDGKATGEQQASSNNDYTEMTVKKGLIEGTWKHFQPDGKVIESIEFDDGVIDGKRAVTDTYADSSEIWVKGRLKSATITQHDPDGTITATDLVTCVDVCGSQNESNRSSVNLDYSKADVEMSEIIVEGHPPRGLQNVGSGFGLLDNAGRELSYHQTGAYTWKLANPGLAKVVTTFKSGVPDGVQTVTDTTGTEVLRATWNNGALVSATGTLWPVATPSGRDAPQPATATAAATTPPGAAAAAVAPTLAGHAGKETRAGNAGVDAIVIFQYAGTNGPEPAFCDDEGVDGIMCRSDSTTEIGVGTWHDFMINGTTTCIAGTPGCVVPKVFATLKPRG